MQLEREQILARLQQARKEAGLTQQEAADVLGVHKRTIENYENNHVPWDKLNELAGLYGKLVEWFLRGEDAALEPTQSARLDRLEEGLAEVRGLVLHLVELAEGQASAEAS